MTGSVAGRWVNGIPFGEPCGGMYFAGSSCRIELSRIACVTTLRNDVCETENPPRLLWTWQVPQTFEKRSNRSAVNMVAVCDIIALPETSVDRGGKGSEEITGVQTNAVLIGMLASVVAVGAPASWGGPNSLGATAKGPPGALQAPRLMATLRMKNGPLGRRM